MQGAPPVPAEPLVLYVYVLPYFLWTACLLTPSAWAIASQDKPERRARRTRAASARPISRCSSATACRPFTGLSPSMDPTKVFNRSTSMASTLVDDEWPVNES